MEPQGHRNFSTGHRAFSTRTLSILLAGGTAILAVVLLSCRELPSSGEAEAARFPAVVEAAPDVRVLVMRDVEALRLSVAGAFSLLDEKGHAIPQRNQRLDELEVRAGKGGFVFGPAQLDTRILTLVPALPDTLSVDGCRWRGKLRLVRSEKPLRFDVVNILNLEAYLCGVLAAETPYQHWPAEALRAQAVASRTYAVYSMLSARRDRRPYDLPGDQFGQVYSRGSEDSPLITSAVNSTRGVVLTHKGEVFPAYFSAVCGGHTEDASNVFAQRLIPPLAGVECPFCRKGGMPYAGWERTFTTEALTNALRPLVEREFGRPLGPVREVEPIAKGVSGRVTRVRVLNALQPVEMNANQFRLALGPRELPSTFFSVRRAGPEQLAFSGKGWGHGVGVCQYGMSQMAAAGNAYHEILGYYYTDSRLTRLAYAAPHPEQPE